MTVYQLLGPNNNDPLSYGDRYKDAMINFSRHKFEEASKDAAFCREMAVEERIKFSKLRQLQCTRLQNLIARFRNLPAEEVDSILPNPYFRQWLGGWYSFDDDPRKPKQLRPPGVGTDRRFSEGGSSNKVFCPAVMSTGLGTQGQGGAPGFGLRLLHSIPWRSRPGPMALRRPTEGGCKQPKARRGAASGGHKVSHPASGGNEVTTWLYRIGTPTLCRLLPSRIVLRKFLAHQQYTLWTLAGGTTQNSGVRRNFPQRNLPPRV